MIRIALGIGILSAASLATKPPAPRAPLATPDSLSTQHVRGALGRKLDSLLTSYEAHGFAGTVLIVRRNGIVLLKGYGFAEIPRRVRNRPATQTGRRLLHYTAGSSRSTAPSATCSRGSPGTAG